MHTTHVKRGESNRIQYNRPQNSSLHKSIKQQQKDNNSEENEFIP